MNKTRCKARAVPDSHVYGYANTGTEQVGLRVECLDGMFQGQSFTWYGYFTDASEQRTVDQLMTAGWTGDDAANLPGLGSTEFELQLEEDEEVDEHGRPTGSTRWRPTFINKIGVAMKNQMDDVQRRSFAARLNAVARNIKGGAAPQRSAPPAQRGAAPPSQRQPTRGPAQSPTSGGGYQRQPGGDDIPF